MIFNVLLKFRKCPSSINRISSSVYNLHHHSFTNHSSIEFHYRFAWDKNAVTTKVFALITHSSVHFLWSKKQSFLAIRCTYAWFTLVFIKKINEKYRNCKLWIIWNETVIWNNYRSKRKTKFLNLRWNVYIDPFWCLRLTLSAIHTLWC